jgi:membrane protein
VRRLLQDAWIVGRGAVREARDDRVPTTAQALAYSLFLAVPAAFLVLLGLFSVFAGESAIAELVSRARTVVPAEAATLLEQSLTRAAQRQGHGIVLTIVGLALALWTTTSAATTLMTGLTTTYDRDDTRSFARKRLVALAIVAALAVGSGLVLVLLVLGPHVESWVGRATGAPTLVGWVWWTAQWPVLVLALLFAFAVVLYLGPNVEQPSWALITPGAVTALVVWLAASGGLAVYAGYFGSYEKIWGTLSAVIVTLVWLWLTSAALLFGAEVNAAARSLAASREGEARPEGRDLGRPVVDTARDRLPRRAEG